MNSPRKNSRYSFSLRPFTFGMTIGLGVGLATKNIAMGIAIGIVFAVVFGAFGGHTKCQKVSVNDHDNQ